LDDAEFDDNITNVFTGYAITPAISGTDFYATIVHEIGHAVGISEQHPTLSIASFLTDSGVDDPSDSNPSGGNLVAFNVGGGPIEATFTRSDRGHLWEGPATAATNAAGLPVHVDELMNPGRAINSNERNLISNLTATILQQAYGYSIVLPSTLNNMLVNANFTTNVLSVQGGLGNADDTISVEPGVAGKVRVSIGSLVENVPAAEVSSISLNSGGGNDSVRFYPLGGSPAITADLGGGTNTLEVVGATNAYDNIVVNGSTVTSTGVNITSFAGAQSLTIYADGGNADISMPSTPGGLTSATIFAGFGDETLNLHTLDTATPVTINALLGNDTINIAPGGSTSAIRSPVTINGDDGNDTLNLVPNSPFGLSVIESPITFNGGNQGDTLNVGSGGLHAVSGLVTFNAGGLGEGNRINLYDAANSFFVDYLVGETSITRDDPFFFGGVNYSGVGAVFLDATQGPNQVTINASSISSAIVNGNGGDDTFVIGNGNNLAGGIGLFTGSGGEGFDTLTLNDSLSTHDLPWAVLGNGTFDPQTIYLGLQAYDLEGYEGATILAGNGNNNFQINGTMAQSVTVHAGGGNDTIELNNVSNFRDFYDQDENPPFNYPMVLDGGGGFNVLINDDANSNGRSYVISPEHMTIYDGAPLGLSFDYDLFGAVNVYGGQYSNDYLVFGTSSDILPGQQMTILGGPDPDFFEVRPHDDLGNLTINGNLGIGGGGGIDSLLVNDSASSLPINYSFYNQFGPGTTNIGGLGAAGFGAGSNVENITISAGGGDDVFDIQTFKSGSALAINAGGGNDWLRFGQGNLISEVTNMASFHFNGQDGADTFDLNNFADTSSYTYSRTSGTTIAARSLGGFYSLNDSNIELLQIWAGPAVDGLYLDAVEPGLMTVFVGGAGADGLAVGYNVNSLENIRGPVVYYAGADGGQLSVWDGLDSTGDTLHVTQNTLGAGVGDDLFGPGGALTYYDVSSIFSINLGSGADTVYAEPLPGVPLSINAAGPTAAPGDTLRFSYAHATNPVFTPGVVGAGTYSFSDAAAVSYTGIETASAYRPGDYDGDGSVTQADYDVWKSQFGQSVTPGTNGDGNGDGIVDAADYTVWLDYLGTTSGAGAGIASSAVALEGTVDSRRHVALSEARSGFGGIQLGNTVVGVPSLAKGERFGSRGGLRARGIDQALVAWELERRTARNGDGRNWTPNTPFASPTDTAHTLSTKVVECAFDSLDSTGHGPGRFSPRAH
ncbi:MAG: beta strand repeat-containing protein, partial [Pirellulales bacterium]